MINKENINPIGIGTFNIDIDDRKKTMEALMYSYEHGQNYIDTSYIYDSGRTLMFLKDFFNNINRDNMFISTKVSKTIDTFADIEKQLDKNLELMGLDFIDSLSLHTPFVTKFPLDETYNEMEKLVKKGKVRFLGISNATVDDMKKIEKSNAKLFSFEGLYNLECKTYEDNGVIEYTKNNNIIYICYQALRRNRTAMQNYPLLVELSKKYGKSQNQIILNWIVKEKGLNLILKSTTLSNIKENIASVDFSLEKEDVKRLNEFRNDSLDALNIDIQK